MEKALKFLKHMKQTDTPYNFRECELDEAIAELEELQQRSCESCRHWDFNEQGHFKKCFNGKGNVSSTKGDFCCNRYEVKEQ